MARTLPLLAAVAAALVISTSATASSPTCTIRGTDRSETLTGTAGRDVICARGGNDRLRGLGGDDVLLGGNGHDVLVGGAGNDQLSGESGEDLFVAEASADGADKIDGGGGSDAMSYSARRTGVTVTLAGAADDGAAGEHDNIAGVQTVTGGAGDDKLTGTAGSDLLAGLGGTDTLEGGAGADAFLGGADADVVKAADGRRDWLISCGAGKDSLAADKSDPRAWDCEGGVTPPPAPPKADLSVTLTDNVDPVVEGDPVEYRFRVDNAGPSTATGVTVATTVPADATVAAATGCTQAGAVVTCAVGDLASGASATGVLTVTHASTGSKTVTSGVDSPVQDPDAEDRTASQATDVAAKPAPTGADVSVSVDAAPSTAVLTSLPYTVTVQNSGPQSATGVSLVMEVDPAWSAIDRPSGCTQSMFPVTRVTCNLGTLDAGASATRVMGVSWGTAGNRTVKATVTGTGPADPVAANNSETETTTVSG